MEIIRTKRLSAKQKSEIIALIDHLKETQGLTLSFPFEYASHFYLLYESQVNSIKKDRLEKELVSVLALIMPDQEDFDTPAECAAFTAPEHQKRGYFSLLFEEAQKVFDDTDLIIYTDGTNEGARKALESLGAEWDFDEYRMELPMESRPVLALNSTQTSVPALSHVTPGPENKPSLIFKTETLPETRDLLFSFFESANSDITVGTACASRSGSHACLYAFEIAPDFRRLGYGWMALSLFLTHLKKSGIETVLLHVSGDNEAALRLYKKTGFRITETLSCYLY